MCNSKVPYGCICTYEIENGRLVEKIVPKGPQDDCDKSYTTLAYPDEKDLMIAKLREEVLHWMDMYEKMKKLCDEAINKL